MDECRAIALAAMHRGHAAVALFDLSLTLNSARYRVTEKAFWQTLVHALSHREAADSFAPIPKELVS